MKIIGMIVFAFIFIILSTLWQSFLFSTSVNWFLTDLKLPLLSQKIAAAFLLFAKYSTYHYIDCPKSNKEWSERIGEMIGIDFLTPILMYYTAAGIHKFM